MTGLGCVGAGKPTSVGDGDKGGKVWPREGPEGTGQKFGAYPELRPDEGCQLGSDKTLVVLRAHWGVCVNMAPELGPPVRWLCICPEKRGWQLG